MLIDFNRPESIAAWYLIHQQRHGPQIAQFAKLWPQFAGAIREAGAIIRSYPKSDKT
jgi:hypothetical protein